MPKKLTDLTAATALADADQFWIEQSGTSKRIAADVFQLPFNYIGGLITSNDSGDTAHDIAIAPGAARSADDTANLKLSAILTKKIDAVWAVGDDAGGLDTGSFAANTLYAIWLIKRPDTGVVDALFSLSFSAPTMPTNYTKKRLIAAVRTNVVPAIVQYIQSGDYFRFLVPANDVSGAAITDATFADATLLVPPNSLAHIYARLDNPTSTASVDGKLWIRAKGAADPAGVSTAFLLAETASNFDQITRSGWVLVDSTSQMQYAGAETTGSASVTLSPIGFTMLTRRDPL